ncbi:thymidine phosphorylase [Pontiella agarivorans]|uniref:thymidine phosphorylase n=1 Tax=Pontiella agarivorans TaxID=3038953 RepID=A0ABU5MUR1_9BACT|nr:thymidine phosphorylase [Pontiella agarivorans]MDZ8117954.1 thymidine phosphorylase [Pontiella agarivorans]
MLPQWIIEKKRDGSELDTPEIREFIEGYTKGDIPDYQMAALAMAIYFNGMTPRETADLTHAMMHSGQVINPDAIPGTKVDKHSTGGIGDKISIPLAPLVAASGATVPMISGRGLGITGGTLDKLEAIPGYRTNLTQTQFFQTLEAVGCSMIGQTPEIAPADKKLYALRDVTATVPSIPLIVSSIMSKKLAEGIDALVLDVKCGSGAFMKNIDDARALAQALVDTGKAMGKKVTALITDMNQPLGRNVGNALEIRESLQILNGKGPADSQRLTLELAKQMLHVAEIHDLGKGIRNPEDKIKAPALHLKDGSAMQKFKQMVSLHGGDLSTALPEAENQIELPAPRSGYISECNAEAIGRAALLLGAGRTKTTDTIDPAVGISNLRKIGEPIEKGQALCTIHSNSRENTERLFQLLETAFSISPSPRIPPPLILETITA